MYESGEFFYSGVVDTGVFGVGDKESGCFFAYNLFERFKVGVAVFVRANMNYLVPFYRRSCRML